jgi:acyl-CoA thioesterase-1
MVFMRMNFVKTLLGALLLGIVPGLTQAANAGIEPQAENKPVILVIGDSLSAEYGLERGSGWVEKISEKLQQERSEYQIRNSSISGDTTSGGLTRLPGALQTHRPEVVVIELGANDALRGLSLDMTRKNLGQMTKLAQKAGAQVLLVGMQIPPNYGRRYTEEFRQLFSDVAQQNKTQLVPFLLDGIAANPNYFQGDGIHPNEQAQPILANNVWAELKPMLTQ